MSAPTSLQVQAFLDAFSLEVSAKAMPALGAEATRIPRGTTISIPWLSSEDDDARLAAARRVRELGFEPMPHLSARRIGSRAVLERFLQRAANEAGVAQCLVIAGDLASPAGPFADSACIIKTGLLETSGIRIVAIGGHPEGHPAMRAEERWQVLEHKCRAIEARGMAPMIITQFAFDAGIVLDWLHALRARGIVVPVLVGVPGPASIARLLRYAAMCGVGASASMLARYGISIGRLLGTAGPEVFMDRMAAGLTEDHGLVSPHFFPFGGIAQSLDWIGHYRAQASAACRSQVIQ